MRKGLLFVCLCGCAVSGQTTYSVNYQSYNPSTGQFNLTQSIVYVLPNPATFGPGPYHVFIHVPGTYETYTSPLAMLFVNQMAARGFLSASVQYMNKKANRVAFNTIRARSPSSIPPTLPAALAPCAPSRPPTAVKVSLPRESARARNSPC